MKIYTVLFHCSRGLQAIQQCMCWVETGCKHTRSAEKKKEREQIVLSCSGVIRLYLGESLDLL